MMVRFTFWGSVLASVVQTGAIRLVDKSPESVKAEEAAREASFARTLKFASGLEKEDPKLLAPVPQQYLGQAQQWITRFLYDVLDGSAAKYDEAMGRCCEIANTTGLRPHEHFGTATPQQISWWNKTGCNKMVGANVLAVGTPLCDTWKFLKAGYVSERVQHLELTNKKGPGCSAEDRAIINASILNGNAGKVKDHELCQPSRLFFDGGRLSAYRFAYCVNAAYTGISGYCNVCYLQVVGAMLEFEDIVTHDSCFDQCAGMDKCWGMEKCIRTAGNCTRCFERVFLRHKFCVGGPIYQPVDGPTVLRKMMGFWTHVR